MFNFPENVLSIAWNGWMVFYSRWMLIQIGKLHNQLNCNRNGFIIYNYIVHQRLSQFAYELAICQSFFFSIINDQNVVGICFKLLPNSFKSSKILWRNCFYVSNQRNALFKGEIGKDSWNIYRRGITLTVAAFAPAQYAPLEWKRMEKKLIKSKHFF